MSRLPPIYLDPIKLDPWASAWLDKVRLNGPALYSPLMARFCLAHELSHHVRMQDQPSYTIKYMMDLAFLKHEEAVCNATALALTGTLPPPMLLHFQYYRPHRRKDLDLMTRDAHSTLLNLQARGWGPLIRSWEIPPCQPVPNSMMPAPTFNDFGPSFERLRSHVIAGAFVI